MVWWSIGVVAVWLAIAAAASVWIGRLISHTELEESAAEIRREFFTTSSRRDRGAAIDALIRSEPHLSVMNGFRDYTAAASFVF